MFFLWLIFALLLLFLVYHIWKREQLAKRLPPGPPAWPLIGNLLQMDRKDPRTTFLEWHKKFGPVFTVWMGTEPFIFVTGFDAMQELFAKRGDEFNDRARQNLIELLANGINGISMMNGDRWREQRRFSMHTLRNFGFGKKLIEEKIEVEAEKIVKSLNDQLGDNQTKNVNLRYDIDLCVTNVISSIINGKSYALDDPHFLRMKSTTDEMFRLTITGTIMLLNVFPWLRFIPLFNHFQFDDIVRLNTTFFSMMDEDIERHKKDFNDQYEPTNFIEAYLQEINRRKKAGEDMGYFSELQLSRVLFDFWLAGRDTTGTTLLWGVLLMMHYPEVQEKVYREIETVVGRQRAPNMGDRNNMPYTHAVVNEVQRFANILPLNIPRATNKDTDVFGYSLPKGTTIIPMIAVALYDDAFYDDPLRFDPSHFIEPDGKTLKPTDHFVPFSLGKRMCVGQGLAQMELFMIFSALMQRFSFSFAPDEPKPDLKGVLGGTMAPKVTIVQIRRRD